MLIDAIRKAYKDKKERGWKFVYVSVDLHGTLCKPSKVSQKIEFYKEGVNALRILKTLPEIKIILNSSVNNKQDYLDNLKSLGVAVDYFNCNPEVTDTDYANFSEKWYYNILIDDKAGFTLTEWEVVPELFKGVRELY